ncbi:hypothetical protein P2318_23830 [Myxococcaceae bacterium GXIMD 01537]
MQKRAKKLEWLRVADEFEASGLTQREFAESRARGTASGCRGRSFWGCPGYREDKRVAPRMLGARETVLLEFVRAL